MSVYLRYGEMLRIILLIRTHFFKFNYVFKKKNERAD